MLFGKRLIAVAAAAAILAGACSTAATTAPGTAAPGTAAPSAAGTGEKVEIVSWWTTGGEATGFNKIIDLFNSQNPQWQVFNSAIAGGAGSNAQAVLQSRVLAGDPPDSFQVHMGHELLDTYVTPGYMDNLDDVFKDNGFTTQFPQGVLDIVSAKDSSGTVHYYSVPANIHRANVLWYNKKILSDNGLTPPKTWDEFMTVAEALKAKGITPLAVGDSGIWANGMILETILIATLGADGFDGLWTGATDWGSSQVTDALNTYKTVLGYINPDHSSLSWDQAADLLISGKAAMTIMGDWANGEFTNKNFADYGWAAAPGNDKIYQALADSFGIPTKAKNKEAIKKFLALLGSAQGQDLFNPYKGSIPANTTAGNPPADAQQYTEYQKSAMAEWTTDAIVPSLEHGAAAAPSWKGAWEQAVTLFVTNTDVAAAQTALVQACKDAKVCT
jgi:glucose/mannose transport system substrate-binding protein